MSGFCNPPNDGTQDKSSPCDYSSDFQKLNALVTTTSSSEYSPLMQAVQDAHNLIYIFLSNLGTYKDLPAIVDTDCKSKGIAYNYSAYSTNALNELVNYWNVIQPKLNPPLENILNNMNSFTGINKILIPYLNIIKDLNDKTKGLVQSFAQEFPTLIKLQSEANTEKFFSNSSNITKNLSLLTYLIELIVNLQKNLCLTNVKKMKSCPQKDIFKSYLTLFQSSNFVNLLSTLHDIIFKIPTSFEWRHGNECGKYPGNINLITTFSNLDFYPFTTPFQAAASVVNQGIKEFNPIITLIPAVQIMMTELQGIQPIPDLENFRVLLQGKNISFALGQGRDLFPALFKWYSAIGEIIATFFVYCPNDFPGYN